MQRIMQNNAAVFRTHETLVEGFTSILSFYKNLEISCIVQFGPSGYTKWLCSPSN